MNTPFVLTPRAEQDLDEIWEYIAADKIDAADRVLDKIAETFEHLAQTPASGTTARIWRIRDTDFTSCIRT